MDLRSRLDRYSVGLDNTDGDVFYSASLAAAPCLRRIDSYMRITDEIEVTQIISDGTPGELHLQIPSKPGYCLDLLIWVACKPHCRALRETFNTSTKHEQRYFLWGSHTSLKSFSDMYRHYVHGAIYESRFSWPHRRRIYSENDAHALRVVVSGLFKMNKGQIYQLQSDQILSAVIRRQGEDGGWRHGEWTNSNEVHFRLHCSALHLLADEFEAHRNLEIRSSLERGIAFLVDHVEKLDVGAWILHDELENSVDAMSAAPFGYVSSRAFGKGRSNMLVLNSHLDALVIIQRYQDLVGENVYENLVDEGIAAALCVLNAAPATPIYSMLFKCLELTLITSQNSKNLSWPIWKLRSKVAKYAPRVLPWIKSLYPRIVMPNGYVDRDLSLQVWAHEYLGINAMDLARAARAFNNNRMLEVAENALHFGRTINIVDRWLELKGKDYAVGFWIEAAYQLYMLTGKEIYLDEIATSVVSSERAEIGLPPSLLGCNFEVVASESQRPTLDIDDLNLKVINLSNRGGEEFLLVNVSTTEMEISADYFPGFKSCSENRGRDPRPLTDRLLVPACGWAMVTSAAC